MSSAPASRGDRFLYVGRLRIRKGVEVLFESLARLKGRGVDVALDVIGDGERLESLRARASALDLSGVRFLGRQGPAEIRRALETARALVVPSTYEGMPLVILEAMESGCPVIATTVSGIPEVVEDPGSGWLVPEQDAEALAAALEDASSDGGAAAARGRRGRELLEERYRPEVVAKAWETLVASRLEDAADPGSGPRARET